MTNDLSSIWPSAHQPALFFIQLGTVKSESKYSYDNTKGMAETIINAVIIGTVYVNLFRMNYIGII